MTTYRTWMEAATATAPDDGSDIAPNVSPWTPAPVDPYSTASLSTPAMPPDQSYYQASASLGETARRAGHGLYDTLDATIGLKGPLGIGLGEAAGYRTAEQTAQSFADLPETFAMGSIGPHLPGGSAVSKFHPPSPVTGMMAGPIRGTSGITLTRGDAGIVEALQRMERGTHDTNNALMGAADSTQRHVMGAIFNPSADMPREVHVSNRARLGVKSQLYTDFSRNGSAVADEIVAAWTEQAPVWRGRGAPPAVANTWPDYFEHPSQYTNVSPRMAAAKDAWGHAMGDDANYARADFNVDVRPYRMRDPQGVYVPHVEVTKDTLWNVEATEAALRSKSGVAQTRGYPDLREHMANNPNFEPQLDPHVLADVHAHSLSNMAAAQTFKQGVGGLTRMEVLQQVHPKLAAGLKGLQANLARLRGDKGTLDAQISNALAHFQQSPQAQQDVDDLLNAMTLQPGRYVAKARAGRTVKDIEADIALAKTGLAAYRGQLDTAGLGDFVFNETTSKFHEPAANAAINSVRGTTLGNAALDKYLLGGLDEARSFALGPDFSPIMLNGATGALSHPEVALFNGVQMARIAFNGDNLAKFADPALVRRYEFATGRTFGADQVLSQVDEFRRPGTGWERIPKIGPQIARFNAAMSRVVDYGTLMAFRNDSAILERFGKAQDIADLEAANSGSKFMARLNPSETGRSIVRAKLERSLLNSSSYKAAPVMLAKDIATATGRLAANATKMAPEQAWEALDGRSQLALIRGATMAAVWGSISIGSALASAEANGLSKGDAVKEVLDPNSGRFGNAILGRFGSLGIGGPLRSAIRGLWPVALRGVAVVLFPHLGQFASSSLVSPVGTAVDLLRDKDYLGNEILGDSKGAERLGRALAYGLERFNLIGGAGIAAVRQGDVNTNGPIGETAAGLAGAIAPQIAGTNYFERTPLDELNRIAHDVEYKDQTGAMQTGAHFYDLPPAVRLKIADEHPGMYNASVAHGSELQQKNAALKERYDREQLASDTEFEAGGKSGFEWRKDYNARQAKLTAERYQLYSGEDMRDRPGVLADYFKQIEGAKQPNGEVDWEQVDAWRATLGDAQNEYIDTNTSLGGTPTAREFQAARHKITESGYWDIPDAVFKAYMEETGNAPDTKQSVFWPAVRKAYLAEATAYVESQNPDWKTQTPDADRVLANIDYDREYGKYTQWLGETRNLWFDNPDHAAIYPLLTKWGYRQPGAAEGESYATPPKMAAGGIVEDGTVKPLSAATEQEWRTVLKVTKNVTRDAAGKMTSVDETHEDIGRQTRVVKNTERGTDGKIARVIEEHQEVAA